MRSGRVPQAPYQLATRESLQLQEGPAATQRDCGESYGRSPGVHGPFAELILGLPADVRRDRRLSSYWY